MKTYKLNRKSLHYKFAEFWEGSPSRDFCNYFWEVVLGFQKAMFIAAGATFVLLCVGVGTWAWIWEGIPPWVVSVPGKIGTILAACYTVFLVLLTMLLFMFAVKTFKDKREARLVVLHRTWWDNEEYVAFLREHGYWPWEKSKKPGFLKLWWKTLKEKTCVRLDFE